MLQPEIVVRLERVKKTFPIASGYISWLRHRGAPPRRPALIDASFSVARGELFGLLGENGVERHAAPTSLRDIPATMAERDDVLKGRKGTGWALMVPLNAANASSHASFIFVGLFRR